MMLFYLLIYRIYFVILIFFMVFCFLFCLFFENNKFCIKVYLGFWILKFVFFLLFVVCVFNILRNGFGLVWMCFGIVGLFLYMLI